MGEITIICDDFEEASIPDIDERIEEIMNIKGQNAGILGRTKTDRSINWLTKSFKSEILKPKVNEIIRSIVSLIDETPLNDKGFDVSELEFNLVIGGENEVALPPIIKGRIEAKAGITIRLQKKRSVRDE